MTKLQSQRKYLIAITILSIAGIFMIKHDLHKTPTVAMVITREYEPVVGQSGRQVSTIKANQSIAKDSFKLTKDDSTAKGVFVFNNQDMKSILDDLGKSYKMKVVYKGAISKKTHFGTFSKSENIADILSFLQKQTGINLSIENSKIIVEP